MNITNLTLHTNNLADTKHFYTQNLQLPLLAESSHALSFAAGSTTLNFLLSTAPNPRYHFTFNIPNNQLQAAIAWSQNNLTLLYNDDNDLITTFDNWNAQSIYFYDNNGSILEFIARFDLNNASTQPFSPQSILNISEIGIAEDAPLNTAETLTTQYPLPYFTKGPKHDAFVALGDDNGLLLIAKTQRNWYPTTLPALPHYTQLTFNTHNTPHTLTFNAHLQVQ